MSMEVRDSPKALADPRAALRAGPFRVELAVVRDIAPFTLSASIAWWTTVRPAGFAPGSAWSPRVTAMVAALGLVAGAVAIARGSPRVAAVVVGGFFAPSALTWALGPETATALSERLELFVGAVAWTAVGVVLMRPKAVSVPRGAEGGSGPTIGASDDVARVAMRDLERDPAPERPVARLTPRKPQPRWAQLPLAAAILICAAVAYESLRVGTTAPDRAVLARVAAAAISIAVLSAAGDLVEVRYLVRREPAPRARLQRALVALALVVVLAFIGVVVLGREP